MRRFPNLDGYLEAQQRGPTPRVRPFVTISRRAGAGGHLLAKALLDVFAEQDDAELFGGWQVFDRKLCELVTTDKAYSGSMEVLLAEEYRTRTSELLHQLLNPSIDQDRLMVQVFGVVRAVASMGKAIILGRAGSELTRDMGPAVHLRLIAPEERCVEGMMHHYGLDERTARSRAQRLEASRARLLKSYFRVDIDDPVLYDAVWNTGRVPIRTIAESVVVALRHQMAAGKSERAR
jgi:cytidylate kinase